jgi:hypothetical protein
LRLSFPLACNHDIIVERRRLSIDCVVPAFKQQARKGEKLMDKKYRIAYGVALCLVLMTISGVLYAAEHPMEHPAGAMKKSLTKGDLAAAIKSFVEKDAKLHGGYFLLYDGMDKKPIALTLTKVHEDRLSKVAEGTYFACADFKATDGALYDLDIFMMGNDKDHLAATEMIVHKVAGKERYSWYEEGSVWKRKPAAMTEKKMEHPAGHEHP